MFEGWGLVGFKKVHFMNSNERHSFKALVSYNLLLFARLLSTKNQIEMELFFGGCHYLYASLSKTNYM